MNNNDIMFEVYLYTPISNAFHVTKLTNGNNLKT
jgi:hypothetical protein